MSTTVVPSDIEIAQRVKMRPIEDVAAEQASAFAAYISQKFRNQDEKVLLLEPAEELTRHFLGDLDHLADDRHLGGPLPDAVVHQRLRE